MEHVLVYAEHAHYVRGCWAHSISLRREWANSDYRSVYDCLCDANALFLTFIFFFLSFSIHFGDTPQYYSNRFGTSYVVGGALATYAILASLYKSIDSTEKIYVLNLIVFLKISHLNRIEKVQKIRGNNRMGLELYLYPFFQLAWKDICTHRQIVDMYTRQ